MAHPASPQRTVVYRIFNDDGDLLYVGCSTNLLHRLKAHQARSWWPDVATITVEHHPNRARALCAESSAIAEEAPRYNVAGQRAADYVAPDIADYVLRKIDRRVAREVAKDWARLEATERRS